MPAIPSLERVRRDGLAQALVKYARDIGRDGLVVELDAGSYSQRPLEQEEALFRMGQEALNNVVKHAQAKRTLITLASEPDRTRLTIADDGIGFPVTSPTIGSGRRGLGLSSMRERAAALGGVVQIKGTPGGGTTVDIELPKDGPI